MKIILRPVLFVSALFVSLFITAFIYKAFDEKLTPEAQAFYTLDPSHEDQARQTQALFDAIDPKALKQLPEHTLCAADQPLKSEDWVQFKTKYPELIQNSLALATSPEITISSTHLSNHWHNFRTLRPVFKILENEGCYLKKNGQFEAALDLYYKLAHTTWRSAVQGNGNMPTMVFLGIYSYSLDQIRALEKVHSKIARPSEWTTLRNEFLKTPLNDFMMKQSRMDAILVFNTLEPHWAVKEKDGLQAFQLFFSHTNEAKNQLIDRIPQMMARKPGQTNSETTSLQAFDAGQIALRIMEQRLSGTKLRYETKFQNLRELFEIPGPQT